MDANEAQEEYEEVQNELRKKEEEVGAILVCYCSVCSVNLISFGLMPNYISLNSLSG
jgi:hypothetical protein